MTNRIKADLHNHFSTWESGWGDFDFIIDKIFRRFGEGVIGLANCDDNRYKIFVDSSSGKSRYERVEVGDDKNALWLPEKNLLVIKAEEVFTKNNGKQEDFLVLGTPKNHRIKARNLAEVIREAGDIGAPTIAIHPYLQGTGESLEKNPELLEYIDSIEIFNSALALFGEKYNALAKKLYQRSTQQNLGCCSFTDGHSIRVIGTSYTEIPELDITSSAALRKSLKESLRQTKSEKHLTENPARMDVLIHAFELFVLRHFKPEEIRRKTVAQNI
jgi:hypothetical protein